MSRAKAPVIPEDAVQRTLIAWARWHGWYVVEFAAKGTHRALRGSVPTGWPDWLAIRDRYIQIETKSTRGKLSDDQKKCIAEIREAGGTVLVPYGIEDGERLMIEAGMERSL
ncbi:hypothetical protein LCGC14_2034030 [marine sediment metagenome]|uniref:VRR-NUC domain-containing protein n=1 Tax=marine sediment metagenome TaxID=412755 RepID=A0A0F9HQT7_9ZZZZ